MDEHGDVWTRASWRQLEDSMAETDITLFTCGVSALMFMCYGYATFNGCSRTHDGCDRRNEAGRGSAAFGMAMGVEE